ncbi:MAG: response regulator transcription factor [Flavobacteriales bacterium]|nr:response regulator transcription factor [Flavobacteriales bacterium]
MPRRPANDPAANATTDAPALVRVAVVDDRDAMRRGIGDQLREIGGYELRVSVATGEGLLGALRQGTMVDVALVHEHLGGLDGTAVVGLLKHSFPQVRVLATCEVKDDILTARAYSAGACGVLLTRLGVTELRNALTDACAGRLHVNPLMHALLTTRSFRLLRGERREKHLLSPRELELLQWMAKLPGYSQEVLARRMHVKLSTIRSFMKNIFRKLGVHNGPAAVHAALKRGLIVP